MVPFASLSQGPDLHVEKGVHIIFVPPEVEPPGLLPTPEELADASASVGDVQPTDVIVFKGRPWHKVNGQLHPHPEVHHLFPQTILDLRVQRDKGVWWSEHAFEIVSIGPHGTTVGPQPFVVPSTGTEPSTDTTPVDVFVARSTVPIPGAKTHEYKISFTRDGVLIDPNMKCS